MAFWPRMSLDPGRHSPAPLGRRSRSRRRRRARRRAPGDRRRDREAHHRPAAGRRSAAGRAVRARPQPVRRRARPREDAAHLDARRDAEPVVPAHPVHARPHAVRHHRHRGARGGSHHRPARVPVHQGPVFAQPRARRRDQPHAAEDPGGAAAVDAGVPRHRRRQTHELPLPFLVFATQNPIEQEGTYPLPEAQLDRFMFQVDVDYPTAEEEVRSSASRRAPTGPSCARCCRRSGSSSCRSSCGACRRRRTSWHAVALCRASRPDRARPRPSFIGKYVSWGAGPRASQFLILAAKARAILDGRFAASIEDVRALARPTLQHRLIPNYHAEAEGLTRPRAGRSPARRRSRRRRAPCRRWRSIRSTSRGSAR